MLVNDERCLLEAQWVNDTVLGWYICYHEYATEFGFRELNGVSAVSVASDPNSFIVPVVPPPAVSTDHKDYESKDDRPRQHPHQSHTVSSSSTSLHSAPVEADPQQAKGGEARGVDREEELRTASEGRGAASLKPGGECSLDLINQNDRLTTRQVNPSSHHKEERKRFSGSSSIIQQAASSLWGGLRSNKRSSTIASVVAHTARPNSMRGSHVGTQDPSHHGRTRGRSAENGEEQGLEERERDPDISQATTGAVKASTSRHPQEDSRENFGLATTSRTSPAAREEGEGARSKKAAMMQSTGGQESGGILSQGRGRGRRGGRGRGWVSFSSGGEDNNDEDTGEGFGPSHGSTNSSSSTDNQDVRDKVLSQVRRGRQKHRTIHSATAFTITITDLEANSDEENSLGLSAFHHQANSSSSGTGSKQAGEQGGGGGEGCLLQSRSCGAAGVFFGGGRQQSEGGGEGSPGGLVGESSKRSSHEGIDKKNVLNGSRSSQKKSSPVDIKHSSHSCHPAITTAAQAAALAAAEVEEKLGGRLPSGWSSSPSEDEETGPSLTMKRKGERSVVTKKEQVQGSSEEKTRGVRVSPVVGKTSEGEDGRERGHDEISGGQDKEMGGAAEGKRRGCSVRQISERRSNRTPPCRESRREEGSPSSHSASQGGREEKGLLLQEEEEDIDGRKSTEKEKREEREEEEEGMGKRETEEKSDSREGRLKTGDVMPGNTPCGKERSSRFSQADMTDSRTTGGVAGGVLVRKKSRAQGEGGLCSSSEEERQSRTSREGEEEKGHERARGEGGAGGGSGGGRLSCLTASGDTLGGSSTILTGTPHVGSSVDSRIEDDGGLAGISKISEEERESGSSPFFLSQPEDPSSAILEDNTTHLVVHEEKEDEARKEGKLNEDEEENKKEAQELSLPPTGERPPLSPKTGSAGRSVGAEARRKETEEDFASSPSLSVSLREPPPPSNVTHPHPFPARDVPPSSSSTSTVGTSVSPRLRDPKEDGDEVTRRNLPSTGESAPLHGRKECGPANGPVSPSSSPPPPPPPLSPLSSLPPAAAPSSCIEKDLGEDALQSLEREEETRKNKTSVPLNSKEDGLQQEEKVFSASLPCSPPPPPSPSFSSASFSRPPRGSDRRRPRTCVPCVSTAVAAAAASEVSEEKSRRGFLTGADHEPENAGGGRKRRRR